MKIKVYFDLPNGKRLECTAKEGESLLKVAQENGVDLEGACEASLACATCHVVVAPEWYDKLSPPIQDELDMLDLATGRARTSRLSCQIKLTEKLNGLVVRLL